MSNIVMAFSPRNIVGCLLKKRLTKGGSWAPQHPPRYALAGNADESDSDTFYFTVLKSLCFHLPTLETERFRKTPFIKLFSKVFVFISVFGSDPG